MRPLFIFSLPRTGSTLAQRILAAHQDIETVAEPWILLPHLYALRDNGIYTDYSHLSFRTALSDFCQTLPGGQATYEAEIAEFARRLYTKAAVGAPAYFLDKTPRYHVIAREIMDIFPEGKFLFLWRNPLAVAASMIETFGHGRWILHFNKIDLFAGLSSLVAAFEARPQDVCAVRFEDLLNNPIQEWERVFAYLQLTFDPNSLSRFCQVELRGDKQDPTGKTRYQSLSQEPLSKWKHTLANPLRKAWCRRYLRWIGADRLAIMGYDLDSLLAELAQTPTSMTGLASDCVNYLYGMVYCGLDLAILKDKLCQMSDWRAVGVHR